MGTDKTRCDDIDFVQVFKRFKILLSSHPVSVALFAVGFAIVFQVVLNEGVADEW